jgi:hypothetical protein
METAAQAGPDQAREQECARDSRGDAGARQTQGWKPELSMDQHLVAGRVDEVGYQHDDERRTHDTAALEVLAQSHETQEERQAWNLDPHVFLCELDHGRLLGPVEHEAQRTCRPPPGESQGNAQENRDHEACLQGETMA